METFDEKQLLKAISEGDEKAFKTFFLYYYPRIKGFINGLLQSQEEAEDLSQDIFLTLWNNRSSLHTINNLKPYLFRISKNAVYRHIERALLFRNYQQKETEKYSPPQESNETDDTIHLKELELLVTMVVEKMPPQRQKIFHLSRKEHKSYKEIADLMHLSGIRNEQRRNSPRTRHQQTNSREPPFTSTYRHPKSIIHNLYSIFLKKSRIEAVRY